MTRRELEKEYDVVNGRVRSPGKFEGEMLYVPYFWDVFLNGGADDVNDDMAMLTFNVTDEDVKEFPELAGRERVKLFEYDSGFVVEL